MDLLPLHPKIVHLPIALAVLMPFVSLGTLYVHGAADAFRSGPAASGRELDHEGVRAHEDD